ncbi:hypothetical protein X566_00260 [Afipia sp. P52-10]|nr:hypothetical protein X566_00260 [Afipia sp. P52-10]
MKALGIVTNGVILPLLAIILLMRAIKVWRRT